MYDNITKILYLTSIRNKIESIDSFYHDTKLIVDLKLKKDNYDCPICHSSNTIFHGYYTRRIIHSVLSDRPCIIHFHQRRYRCLICHKTFYEPNPLSSLGDNISIYTKINILMFLKGLSHTFKSTGERYFVSTKTVINLFDQHIQVTRRELPKSICIDEFYVGSRYRYKYACVLLDFDTGKIIDVLPSRRKDFLIRYFSHITEKEKSAVSVVSMDMWPTYKEVFELCFPKIKVAVDSFHVIRSLNDIIKFFRINTMNLYKKESSKLIHNDMYYYMLKKFHYFFIKDYESIYDGLIKIPKMRTEWHKSEVLKYLLSINPDLTYLYKLKERYRDFNLTAEYHNSEDDLYVITNLFLDSKYKEIRSFGHTLSRWHNEIINSFIRSNNRRISNGPIESTNSKIKTILKNANGIHDFERLRNKVMYAINKDIPIKDF